MRAAWGARLCCEQLQLRGQAAQQNHDDGPLRIPRDINRKENYPASHIVSRRILRTSIVQFASIACTLNGGVRSQPGMTAMSAERTNKAEAGIDPRVLRVAAWHARAGACQTAISALYYLWLVYWRPARRPRDRGDCGFWREPSRGPRAESEVLLGPRTQAPSAVQR